MTIDELTLSHIKNHESVNQFIERVKVQIYTQEEADAIIDELFDHIYSLTLDYIDAGHLLDSALHKALLQMGDPTEIGYNFTDYDAMKLRRRLLVFFKALGILLFVITIGVTVFLTDMAETKNQEHQLSVELSDYDALRLHVATQNRIEGFFSYASFYAEKYFMGIFYLLYFPLIFYSNFYRLQLNGIPLKRLDISKDPLMILWPYKKKFPWEYVLISLFFAPIVIIFILLMVFEGVSFFAPISFIASISLAVWLFFYSEKFRIPRYVILEDGIVVKNRLITWVAIDKVSWVQDYSSKGNHYKLMIESLSNPSSTASGMNIKRTIFVNRNQYSQVSHILNTQLH